jgi:hypothetical protein
MIPGGVQVFVTTEPVDLRAGFDRLAGFAREVVGLEPSLSTLFVFFGRRRDTMKIIFIDRTGRCLFHNYRSSHCTSFGSIRGCWGCGHACPASDDRRIIRRKTRGICAHGTTRPPAARRTPRSSSAAILD